MARDDVSHVGSRFARDAQQRNGGSRLHSLDRQPFGGDRHSQRKSHAGEGETARHEKKKQYWVNDELSLSHLVLFLRYDSLCRCRSLRNTRPFPTLRRLERIVVSTQGSLQRQQHENLPL